jgi:sec-independent protein translocase protein TatB
MFEISWSELLILGIVTLIFVGPKELPVFLRTIGRYAGVIKRHANEFRAQFDAAMREVELDQMRKEVDAMQASINKEVMSARSEVEMAGKTVSSAFDEHHIQPKASSPQDTNGTRSVAELEGASRAELHSDEKEARTSQQAMPPMPAPPRMEP